MVWTKGLLSFDSLMQCHEYYLDKVDVISKSIIDLKSIFRTDRYILAISYKQMALYVEKTFKCSGVCKKSLFFYSLDLKQGPPQVTCGEAVMESVVPYATSLGVTILVVGLIQLVMCKSTLLFWCRWRPYEK